MKIKYNFGLIKNLTVGFFDPETGKGYHGKLKNVRKKGKKYQFLFDDYYIEIPEEVFLICRFTQVGDGYYFVPGPKNLISGLFVYTMYDTYGFPMEITQEILEEKGFLIDKEGFELMKKIQKQKNQGTFKDKDAFTSN